MENNQTLLEKLDISLDAFEQQRVGLPSLEINNEVHKYLKMSYEDLQRLTPEDCGCASYLLRKFSLSLQRSYGRESARVKFLDRQLRQVIANEVSQYRAGSAEERRELAIKGSDSASKLAKQRDFHEARMERLAFLSNSVNAMAASLDELQRTKRNQRNQ